MTSSQIKKLRSDLGLTQQQLADLVGAALKSAVYRWEKELSSPSKFQKALMRDYMAAARIEGVKKNLNAILKRQDTTEAVWFLLNQVNYKKNLKNQEIFRKR